MRLRIEAELEANGGNVRAAARTLGIARGTIHRMFANHGRTRPKPIAGGKLRPAKLPRVKLDKGKVHRFLCTSAQNNTFVHPEVWKNLTALAEYYGADILVGTYTYNKNAYGQMSVKQGEVSERETKLWYDPVLLPFIEKWDNQNIEIAPGLQWCGRANILPTAVNPLNGFETYTQQRSGIFPHAKLAMVSVPTNKSEPTKFNYTTGTVTQLNYVQKRAGQLAEFHHAYGALLVEVASDGVWFARQINADDRGTIYDLELRVSKGAVEKADDTVVSITWGDIHSPNIDPTVRALAWGQGGILDTLRPKYQFFHDLIDFRSRNHHDRKDPHKKLELWMRGQDRIEDEMRLTANFLHESSRPWCLTVSVDSNHDRALLRWMKETDWREDPPNAEFYIAAQSAIMKAMRASKDFHAAQWALRKCGAPKSVRFLRPDESFVVLGIEQGMHGDLGPNGSRGSPSNLRRMGRRMNTGHTHTCGIYDGLYIAGHSAEPDQGYNIGPGSWSHTFTLTYANGKRSLVTIIDGRWRAT